jgi:hypothetical protein
LTVVCNISEELRLGNLALTKNLTDYWCKKNKRIVGGLWKTMYFCTTEISATDVLALLLLSMHL